MEERKEKRKNLTDYYIKNIFYKIYPIRFLYIRYLYKILIGIFLIVIILIIIILIITLINIKTYVYVFI
nr:MAG TPA: hypothetical protein [Caudoviricetes sp.]